MSTNNALVPLLVLAGEINTAHEKCQQFYGTMLMSARDCGEKLVQARSQVTHGFWSKWITDNCDFAERTAQKYIQVYRNWEQIESISALDEADLSINGMLDAIADKSAPEIKRRSLLVTNAAAVKMRPPKLPIVAGDRVRVTDPLAPDYLKETVVAEIVQDAIAVTDTGALLLNQVELVERIARAPMKEVTQRVVTPRFSPSLPPTQSSDEIPKKREITVAALQDVLRRILTECGDCLPQELIDEARELL